MRKLLAALLLLGFAHLSEAQTALKGRIVDTLEKRNLENAVVSLLRKSDSTLYSFTRTSATGQFYLQGLDSGHYLLLVTYPKAVDFMDEIRLENRELDLGQIPLMQKAALLEAVMVKQNIAIRMKGDTIEYKADSFKVEEGASVKDLLRKLPGLQVDMNGKITAQGQKVEKVLVDGEEFFSDDPAVVIENLRADAIDKVQSFDKKSDQSEFTGVDDGSRSKTLNLVLKDDKKKGYLGKIVLAGGTDERYSPEAMINYFKGKKKFSIYGIASNTGKTGLGWDDRGKFGSGSDFGDAEVEMGMGFIMITSEGDDDFGDWSNMYYEEGIPRTIKAGAHASNKWNEDKQNANGNYSLKNMQVHANGNSLTKYILPDSAYYFNERHTTKTTQTEQLFSGLYDLKLDSNTSFRIKFNGKLDQRKNNTVTNSGSDDEQGNPVNTNYRTNESNSDSRIFLGSFLWRQKLRKKGRTLSLSASHKNSETNSSGYLYSEIEQFNNGPVSRDTVDQFKDNESRVLTTNAKLVYTEPMGKKNILEFNYAFQNASSTSDRQSFDKTNGKYEFLNQLFSIRYGLKSQSNSAGLKYQYNGKKIIANLGSNLGFSSYKQEDSLGREVRTFRYTNLFPTARITYKMAVQRNVNLNYSGTPQPPSVDQIQPIRENTNPLFIKIGNPLLQQAFRHNISAYYNDFKMLSGRNIWLNGSIMSTQNAIVTNQQTINGITTQQFINTKGNYNFWFFASYGFKLKKSDIQIGTNLRTDGGNYVNFVNGVKNVSRNNSQSFGFYLTRYKEDKFEISFTPEISFNRNNSSINKIKNSFWSQQHNARMNIFLSKKLQIGSEANVYMREKTDAFTGDNNFIVWDASLTYKLFKKNTGLLRLQVNDILKERRGYERRFTSNQIYERNYEMLSRYALLSFTWNFTKTPGTTK